ncbi:hypothetical protein [Polaromonas sp.]|uniref:hypothetical protein n=1 Tax=Polaromonas sp. TaxID=1869339 RepID=UPI001A1C45FE|nr:hypothetical protein [Burkholderiales bacterium]MBH2017984.1 hypothetical protein [Burkholderiales bacterium]
MLTVAITVKLIAEIALLALFGQGLLGLMMSGENCNRNPFYALLQLLGRPWLRAARWLSPRVVLERHVPLAAFFLLLLVWGAASWIKVSICLQIGVALCK